MAGSDSPVDAAARCEYKMRHMLSFGQLEQILCASNVGVIVRKRIFYRRPYTGFSPQVNDRVVLTCQLEYPQRISDI